VISSQPTIAHPSQKPVWRRRQFWRVALPIAAALSVLIAGLLTYNSIYGSNGSPNAKAGWGVTYPAPAKPKTVKLDASIGSLITRFVKTAVARKNLEAAYAISGPQIRQGMTVAQFSKGAIAVPPFAVDARTTVHVDHVVYSYANRAQLQVSLGTPGRKVSNSPHTFFADLVKQGGGWVVNTWVPRWTPPIPTQPGR
jgi:hypothetical protein